MSISIIQDCKLQLFEALLLVYIGVLYVYDGITLRKLAKRNVLNPLFLLMLAVSIFVVLSDGMLAITVEGSEQKLLLVWRICIMAHHISEDLFVSLFFWYWVVNTVGKPRKMLHRILCFAPAVISVILSAVYLPGASIVDGEYMSYALGGIELSGFVCISFYCIMTMVVVYVFRRNLSTVILGRLNALLVFMEGIVIFQLFFPEFWGTTIGIVLVILNLYLNLEEPAIKALVYYHNEMVNGFANLIENRDGNTGGHVKRTTAYAMILAKKLRSKPKYRYVITRDFLNNMMMAAPLHDVGKINTPDSVLQKPGRLTDEEYATMKEHATVGGRIIEETFGHLLNEKYERMAHNVALHHHEKWNGKGYPDGLAGEEIPLSARIVAVADVFDAVSAKRVYRDAMPWEACTNIIRSGRGTDFDPEVVDAFFEGIDEIKAVYESGRENE